MSIQSMTFDESFGTLPTRLRRLYKRVNVSPADHDQILDIFGFQYATMESIPADVWDKVYDFVLSMSTDGSFRPGAYFFGA